MTTNPENCIKAEVGQRFLLKIRENDSIGEFEFIEPTQCQEVAHIVWTGKWWDGEFSGTDYLLNPERIIERTPENLAKAGKQVFPSRA